MAVLFIKYLKHLFNIKYASICFIYFQIKNCVITGKNFTKYIKITFIEEPDNTQKQPNSCRKSVETN